jgi:RES domain
LSSEQLPLPPPSFDRRPLIELWLDPIVRVHHSRFGPAEFNPGRGPGGRFDPLHDRNGEVVPTLYGASTLSGAISESIFRKVPVRGERTLAADTLMPLQASTLQASRALRLIDLRGFGLQRLGVSRRELIDSDADSYPGTRAWAAALYGAVENADGMIWMARQHDLSAAVLLFGTRVGQSELEIIEPPRPLARGGSLDAMVIIAAEIAGIAIVY